MKKITLLGLILTGLFASCSQQSNNQENTPISNITTQAIAGRIELSQLTLIHSEATIKASPNYAKLNALSDYELKQTVLNPINGDYITLRSRTDKRVFQGNTRVYLLRKKGFGSLTIPYDVYGSEARAYYDQ